LPGPEDESGKETNTQPTSNNNGASLFHL